MCTSGGKFCGGKQWFIKIELFEHFQLNICLEVLDVKKKKKKYENIKYTWIHTTDTAESSVSRIMTEFLGM